MARGNVAMWGLVLALGLTATASAADERWREGGGRVKVFLKGGIGNYTGGLANIVNVGPSWGLTVDLQPLHILSFEVGYEGALNSIRSSALDLALTRHGASALAKLSLPFFESVKPFIGAGIGGSYIFLNSTSSNLASSNLVGEVPLTVGVEFNAQSLTAGLRATYRLLLDENLRRQLNRPSGGYADIGATVGVRF